MKGRKSISRHRTKRGILSSDREGRCMELKSTIREKRVIGTHMENRARKCGVTNFRSPAIMEESSTAIRILVRLGTACQWIGRYMYLHIEKRNKWDRTRPELHSGRPSKRSSRRLERPSRCRVMTEQQRSVVRSRVEFIIPNNRHLFHTYLLKSEDPKSSLIAE